MSSNKTYHFREVKPRSSSSPLSIRFLSQETIADRVKLKPQERKKNRNRIKNFNSKQTINQASNIINKEKLEKVI